MLSFYNLSHAICYHFITCPMLYAIISCLALSRGQDKTNIEFLVKVMEPKQMDIGD